MAVTKLNNHHHKHYSSGLGMLNATLPLLLFIVLCYLWPDVVQGRVFQLQWSWIPSLDLYLRFRIDGLALLCRDPNSGGVGIAKIKNVLSNQAPNFFQAGYRPADLLADLKSVLESVRS